MAWSELASLLDDQPSAAVELLPFGITHPMYATAQQEQAGTPRIVRGGPSIVNGASHRAARDNATKLRLPALCQGVFAVIGICSLSAIRNSPETAKSVAECDCTLDLVRS